MELFLCLLAAFTGQLFSILYNTRDYLKTRTFDWPTWSKRNLVETVISLLMAVIAAYFFYITDFRFFSNTFGLELSDVGEQGACFVIGLLLDTVVNLISKVGIRKKPAEDGKEKE